MSATVLTELAITLSERPVAGIDPRCFLGEAAVEIARALDVDGAVLVVPRTGWVRGSDDVATLVGELQHRDDQGPLCTAARATSSILTPDLTPIGPPALAALAAEVGFTRSVAVALLADGQAVAGLQLIGRAVEIRHIDALAPALAGLGARIADLIEFARLRRVAASMPLPVQAASRIGRTAVARPLIEAPPELVTDEMRTVDPDVLPRQRREPMPGLQRPGPRHRSKG